ncbi:MAG: DUF429 domain-containing protein [Nanoarchaeota archaeon]|nr:DUF429 domain-containing protein [Nanoarchaeota archaeon]MBU1854987.1 DUF429 domain-containing protein [Nanoarchaeota archaeon]
MKIIGLDLAGTEGNTTGFCLMGEEITEVSELMTNEEIVSKVEEIKPDVVAIDAPLSFPTNGNWRQAEYDMNSRKIKFFPPKGLLAMEKLTVRGIALKDHFQKKGFLVIEVYPGAFYDILNMPRKGNYLELKRLLKIYNLNLEKREYSQHELDAVASAFTARLFLEAKVEFLGSEDEGQIVVPKVR